MSYLIDEIYSKERRYIKNVDKDNFLNAKSPIFRLDQFRHLKSNTGVEKRDYSRLVANQLQEDEGSAIGLALQCTAGGGHQQNRPPAEHVPDGMHQVTNPAASFPSSKNTDGGSALLPQVAKPETAPINPSEQDGIVLGFRNESALAPTNFPDKMDRMGADDDGPLQDHEI